MKRAIDEQLRIDLYNNRAREHCEWCGRWIALNQAIWHEVKTRGAHGQLNDPDWIIIVDLECHNDMHSGKIRKKDVIAKLEKIRGMI